MCLFQQERAIREHQHGIITFIFIINLSIIVTSPHLCCSPNHFHIKHTVESSLISVSVWDKRTLTHSLLLLFPPPRSLSITLCVSLSGRKAAFHSFFQIGWPLRSSARSAALHRMWENADKRTSFTLLLLLLFFFSTLFFPRSSWFKGLCVPSWSSVLFSLEMSKVVKHTFQGHLARAAANI